MTSRRHVVIGTAGHIDHGKSTLVRALTGIDPDRLPEEQRRGITIDLGFAHYRSGDLTLSFVDVPGHERFVHNMLAGATGIDWMMLVVAADEAVMPQSREHLAIAQLLAVPLALVALTRADLVDGEILEMAREDVRNLLARWGLEGVPIVPVSGVTGLGLDLLRAELERAVGQPVIRAGASWPRLPIDRVFAAKGFGTIVTGTLQGAALSVGTQVRAIPGSAGGRVRGLQSHGGSIEKAEPHSRVAVNLQGVHHDQLERGMTLVVQGYEQTSLRLDTELSVLKESSISLQGGSRVRIHHGTAEVMARVRIPGGGEIAPGQRGFVQLRLEQPIAALPGDRLIVRRYSPVETLAGGLILRLGSARQTRLDERWSRDCERLACGTIEQRVLVAIEQAGIAGSDLRSEALSLGLTPTEAMTLAGQLDSVVRMSESFVISLAAEQELLNRIREGLRRYHRAHPLDEGIAPELLRAELAATWPNEAWRRLLQRAAELDPGAGALVLSRDVVRLASHRGAADEATLQRLEQIRIRLERAGYEGMTEAALAEELGLGAEAQPLIALAARAQRLVRLPQQLLVAQAVWDDVVHRLRSEAAAGLESIEVATFKQLFQLTRRVAIPMLERLDDLGVTQRIGNARRVRRPAGHVDERVER